MKADDRFEIIIRMVQEKGKARVSELSELMECSEVTIRNDIRKLDEQGVLKKTHGGAEKLGQGLTAQFVPGEYYLNAESKKKIARRAYEYIEDQESIMIDDSTTCCYLAQCIRENPQKRLSVVTNSLYAAVILSEVPHVNVYVLGGQILSNPAAAMGTTTAENVAQYHVNKLFSGINKIDFKVGMTSADEMHAEVKRAMIGRADESYILADHTKFGGGSLFTVCGIKEIKCIVTDSGVSREIIELAGKMKIKMDVV